MGDGRNLNGGFEVLLGRYFTRNRGFCQDYGVGVCVGPAFRPEADTASAG